MRQTLSWLCLVSLARSKHVARRPDGTEYSARTMERVWRVLGEFPVIDGHNDFPMAIRDLFHNDIEAVNFDHDLTQVLFFLSQILKQEDKWHQCEVSYFTFDGLGLNLPHLYSHILMRLQNFSYYYIFQEAPWNDFYMNHCDLPRMREGQMGGQFW